MKLHSGDTVALVEDPRIIGIVERRSGSLLTIRFPERENKREQYPRNKVRALAEFMYEARLRGTKFRHNFSLTGDSTLTQLVAAFGYATERLRKDSLEKVLNQLLRAGLEIRCSTDRWGRDDKFSLIVLEHVSPELEDVEPTSDSAETPPRLTAIVPDPFWPTALGLDANREVAFLRALTNREPLLCLLHIPDDTAMQSWLQATWEGVVGWAYRSAQRFASSLNRDFSRPEILVGPAGLLHTYLKTSVLNVETPRLLDRSHCLNLVTLKKDSEFPVDFLRLQAAWPSPIFEFKPEPASSADGQHSANIDALVKCLLLVAGTVAEPREKLSPLKVLLWAKKTFAQILARGSLNLGYLLSSGEIQKFKGSTESETALALKAHLAQWIKKTFANASLQFEETQIEGGNEEGNLFYEEDKVYVENRVDLLISGIARVEVESLVGSGPIEAFYHQKVFSRVKQNDLPLWLVLPNDAILWAGPYLADLAHHLGSNGHVLLPGDGDAYLEIQGKPLAAQEIEIDIPWIELATGSKTGANGEIERPLDSVLRLKDVIGYKSEIQDQIEEIIWLEKHGRARGRPSRSSGILFFGPPGCGKSRLAQAIAGELEHEVRLLGPSDLRGPYIGWGQVMIREQFDWLAERSQRMLVIDELDAVARSRRGEGNMHSDEKADVNELLVQLDRVSRLGRLVVGTTNYVASLDDAVIRSGRFGRFLPVPPPNLEDSVEILDYYLNRLAAECTHRNQPIVQWPQSGLRTILEPLIAENFQQKRCFCGADLEEAVNQTYQRCFRQAIGDKWPEDYAGILINLSQDELTRSLREVRRSVTAKALRQFLRDTDRYCGSTSSNELGERLGFPTWKARLRGDEYNRSQA